VRKPQSGLRFNLESRIQDLSGGAETLEKPQSGFSYRVMSFTFKISDIIRPRGNILKEIGIKPGFQVLDFGCGPGGYTLPAAKLVGETGKIYALDMNPAAILTVKSLAAKHKLANVQTILSDGATALPDDIIDVVFLYDLFHYLKKPNDVLTELHRVLKPAGILSASYHHMNKNDLTSRVSGTALFRLSREGKQSNFIRIQ
jgi:ubiquinone/menaquinone biosynthesis C-methylase UbiE